MYVRITLTLFLVSCSVVNFHCSKDPACPQRDVPHGVLILSPNREVLLSCNGDITVDKEQIATTGRPKQRVNKLTTGYFTTSGRKQGKRVDKDDPVNGTNRNVSENIEKNTDTTGKLTAKGHVERTTVFLNRHTSEGVTPAMSVLSDEDYNADGARRVTRGIRHQAHWTLNGHPVRGDGEEQGSLRFSHFQMAHKGTYRCYRGERLISSFKIHVGLPPEKPNLSCYRKSHITKIWCDWTASQPVTLRPQCKLLLRKELWEKPTSITCDYSYRLSRCRCFLPSVGEGERTVHFAKLCMSNMAGSATSPDLVFTPQGIIKPDPPSRIRIEEVVGQSHALVVSWAYPSSWKQGYYFLLFQLRYKPLQGQQYQVLNCNGPELFWQITDAIPCTQYELQLRAKDEFDGHWSDWTEPMYAYTWSAAKSKTPSDHFGCLYPTDTIHEGSGLLAEDDNFGYGPSTVVSSLVENSTGGGVMWTHAVWVLGLCLFTILAVLSIYAFRSRMHLLSKLGKLGSVPSSTSSPPPPPPSLSRHPTDEGKSLMTPQSPDDLSERPHHILQGDDKTEEGIHLHNVDYFLSQTEQMSNEN